MSARDEVLASIRRSLGVTGREEPRRAVVEGRLSAAPRGLIPARGQVGRDDRISLFVEQASAAHATVVVLDDIGSVPSEIARVLRDANAPATIRMGEDAALAALPWGETALSVERGRSDGTDLNAVSMAFGGIAETGTLAFVSGPDNPTTLNFLTDNHLVVLRADDIAGDYETVFARLGSDRDRGGMPRTLNLITGPSRSADIEQTLVLGAHGPRRLHVMLVR